MDWNPELRIKDTFVWAWVFITFYFLTAEASSPAASVVDCILYRKTEQTLHPLSYFTLGI